MFLALLLTAAMSQPVDCMNAVRASLPPNTAFVISTESLEVKQVASTGKAIEEYRRHTSARVRGITASDGRPIIVYWSK